MLRSMIICICGQRWQRGKKDRAHGCHLAWTQAAPGDTTGTQLSILDPNQRIMGSLLSTRCAIQHCYPMMLDVDLETWVNIGEKHIPSAGRYASEQTNRLSFFQKTI